MPLRPTPPKIGVPHPMSPALAPTDKQQSSEPASPQIPRVGTPRPSPNRLLSQRSVEPFATTQQSTPEIASCAIIEITFPSAYKQTEVLAESLQLNLSQADDIEAVLTKQLGGHVGKHLFIECYQDGKKVPIDHLKNGGAFELRLALSPKAQSAIDNTHTTHPFEKEHDFRPMPLRPFQKGFYSQLTYVAGGHCPAGVIDIQSPLDVTQEILAQYPHLDYQVVQNPLTNNYQLLFWRQDSTSAEIAALTYLERQDLQLQTMAEERYLGMHESRIMDRHRALQLEARRQLVGGDKSWNTALRQATKKVASHAHTVKAEEQIAISPKQQLQANGVRIFKRITSGQAYGDYLKTRSTATQKLLQTSTFIQQELPAALDKVMAKRKQLWQSPLPRTDYGIEWHAKLRIKEVNLAQEELLAWAKTEKNLTAMEKKELDRVITCLDSESVLLLQVMTDPGVLACAKQGMSWNQAMEFKRLGYQLDPDVTRLSPLNDSQLAAGSKDKKLGSGRFNTVYQLDYLTKDGKQEQRVFKPIAAQDESGWGDLLGEEKYLDTKRPHFTLRNYAAAFVRDSLALEGLVPDAEFVEHNGQLGLAMTIAKGTTGYHMKKNDEIKTLSSEARRNLCAQLNQLEWLDALCAQPDRHTENYLIDPATGNVIGVDNDIGFTANPDIVRKTDLIGYQKKYSAGARTGFPLLVDKDMLESLRALDIDALIVDLSPTLTMEELDAMKERFVLLRNHAEGLALIGYCVDDWKTWREPDAKDTAESYLRYCSRYPTICLDNLKKQHAEVIAELSQVTDDENYIEELAMVAFSINNLIQSMKIAAEHSYFGELVR